MDRLDAGRRLAARLGHLRDQDVVVLGLPRGGVPVAAPVAEALGAPLDVCLVRKLGVPFQPELGMGAIGEDGVLVINNEVVRRARVSSAELDEVEDRERAELERRIRRYRGERAPIPLRGRTVVVVDDGVATGSTARAACQLVRARGAARVVLATPVAPPGWTRWLSQDADELICLHTPEDFFGIGQFYADFTQTSDEEVVGWLARAAGRAEAATASHGRGQGGGRAGGGEPAADRAVMIPVDQEVCLPGALTVPDGAVGVVLFAHGSGSGRHSPRNRYVAAELNRAGLGALLFDLLTEEEAFDRANVFDTELLAGRLTLATRWLADQPEAINLPAGYFGASTGAAAALWAAAEPGSRVAAVVSRGGRPDLAGPRLAAVTAPTLLIVGGADDVVLDLNRRAQARLRCPSQLEVVPGATHLFEEPGALERVAELAKEWFSRYLAAARTPARH